MRHIVYIAFVLLLVSCGNASRPKNYDWEDSTLLLPDTEAIAPVDTPTTVNEQQESSHENKIVPTYIPEPKSAEYEEGYHKGYADGEEDAYTHSGYQCTYDDSNDYSGDEADDYEKGYSNGYEDGYDDNVEYEK